jgi:hypothetical protein
VDPVGGVAGLLLVLIVDWTALATRVFEGRAPRAPVAIFLVRRMLPLLLVMAVCVRLSVGIGPLSFRWGAVWAYGIAVVLCLLGVFSSVSHRRVWSALVTVLLVAEALRIHGGFPPLASLVSEVKRPEGLLELGGVACDIASAMLLAVLFTAAVYRGRIDTGAHLWAMLAGATLLQFVAGPLVEPWRGSFSALTVPGWVTGTVAFAAALACGARGLVLAPVILAIVAVVVPMFQGGIDSPLRLLTHGVGVAAIAAMYGFVGMLLRRSLKAGTDAARNGAGPLDVSRLAHFIGRLDTSATLRSFGALLVVAGVGVALVESGVMSIIFSSFGDRDFFGDEDFALAWALFLPFILSPLAFIAFDAMARQDRLRPLSALSGAALTAVGLAAVAALVGVFVFLPSAWIDDSHMGPKVTAAVAAIVCGLLALPLVMRSRWAWLGGGVVFALAAVACAALFSVLLKRSEDGGSSPAALATMAAEVLAMLVILVLIGRGAKLRADLSGEVPRGLLFGEIAGGGFWARLACLMGMPASMWNRAALRTPAFWALLFARPLVYAGAIGIWKGYALIGALALVAGHATFKGGKQLAARSIWRAGANDGPAPVLFLRSFEDDQFDLGGRSRRPWRRWLELWSFRRNLDEMLVDEVAKYGAVVALGRPGETTIPFGASRYYSTHDDWQRIITETARRAHTIVVVAGDTPGVRWEYDLLAREGLLERTVLLFRPGTNAQGANRAALAAFPLSDAQRARLGDVSVASLVALLHLNGRQVLLSAERPDPAAYVLALRTHFQHLDAVTLAEAAQSAPPPVKLGEVFAAA